MRRLLAAAFVVLGLSGPAGGADPVPPDCAATRQACAARCGALYPGERDDMARAGCSARCDIDVASCEARRAIDQTQSTVEREVVPWVTDQADRVQRFLDGFRNRPAEPQPPPGAAPPGPAPGGDRGTPL